MKKNIDVINLHLTEICNYSCSYCFAKFNNNGELVLEQWKDVVDKIANFYSTNKVKGRINLAGGEPMILPWLDELIYYIYNKGIDVSIITNASFLTKDKIDNYKDKLSMIGVSIDSLDEETNKKIGRCTRKGKTINYDYLVEVMNYAKSNGIILKVNTVVSKINLDQNISKLYNDIDFDRIKLLELRVNKGSNSDAIKDAITNEQFETYCNKVKSMTNKKVVCESSNEIEDSYVFIDPYGFLISNSNDSHSKVGNVLNESLEDLIVKANFNLDKFLIRYE